jgi:hypothetical protein
VVSILTALLAVAGTGLALAATNDLALHTKRPTKPPARTTTRRTTTTPPPSHGRTSSESRPHVTQPAVAKAIDQLSLQANDASHQANATAAALRELKAVILDNPTQAISYTLLKREVAANQTTNASAIADIEKSVNKAYELMKWVIVAFCLGLLGIVVSAYRGKDATS